jgi:hypothetical protein
MCVLMHTTQRVLSVLFLNLYNLYKYLYTNNCTGGGSDCSSKPGGASQCCASGIKISYNRDCASNAAPCVRMPAAAVAPVMTSNGVSDPTCANGIYNKDSGACCLKSCGSCKSLIMT